jgi:hypothetical protein
MQLVIIAAGEAFFQPEVRVCKFTDSHGACQAVWNDCGILTQKSMALYGRINRVLKTRMK